MSARLLRRLRPAAIAAGLLLAGCETSPNAFPPVCPQLSLLKDAADLTRFAATPGATRDARSLIVQARIVAVPAHCANPGGDANQVRATLKVVAELRRGPAARGDTVQVPYFVAVMEGDRVLREQDAVLSAEFRPNVDTMRASGDEIDITVPVSKTKTAAAYHLYVGFRLTPDELAYNRAQPQSE